MVELRMLTTDKNGEEKGYAKEIESLDLEIGDTNSFEAIIPIEKWSTEKYIYKNRFFIPETEYGGLIDGVKPDTDENIVTVSGSTWRGLIDKKVVVPPDGQNNLILNGELNSVLRDLIGLKFDGLITVPNIDTGVNVINWSVDRYVTLLDAIKKLLKNYNKKISIKYKQPDGLERGYVTVEAVDIVDTSNEMEYTSEGRLKLKVKDYRGGINHLVCAGTGQNEERIILHLYVQEDGSIGGEKYYKGLEEREAVYSFTSAEEEQLLQEGTKRLEELKSKKTIETSVDDVDLELGDIVSGYEKVTNTYAKAEIVKKILKIVGGETTIDYKVEGDE